MAFTYSSPGICTVFSFSGASATRPLSKENKKTCMDCQEKNRDIDYLMDRALSFILLCP